MVASVYYVVGVFLYLFGVAFTIGFFSIELWNWRWAVAVVLWPITLVGLAVATVVLCLLTMTMDAGEWVGGWWKRLNVF